jgi:hypothetical protein
MKVFLFVADIHKNLAGLFLNSSFSSFEAVLTVV